MKNSILYIKDLKKNYGNKNILKGVNLDLKKGHVMGLLGPNGSGKTTLVKIITNLIEKTSGEIYIDAKLPSIDTKKIVSFLPDRNFFPPEYTALKAMKLFKDFYDDFNEKKCFKLMEFMNLELDMKVSEMSKGMKEKFHLAMVLSRDAKLYILDEPIAGVDPVARDKILEAIISCVNENSSMIITTHLVKDIENIFDDVCFIDDGKIVESGSTEEISQKYNSDILGVYKKIFGGKEDA